MRQMFWILLAALAASPSAATAQSAQPPTREERAASAADVTLQPGDLIELEIWREEDLSGEFLVDESGTVTLPLVGRFDVRGIPIAQLRDTLIAAYSVELRNPSIIVTPLRRVYVLGEVNEPGLQAVDPTVSLAGAIALAGGATERGDLRRIRVIRNGEEIVNRVRAESALSALDVRSGDQIFVGQRSWFERNTTFLVSAILSGTSLLITLLR